jgi:tape measure domain-containing protein
MESLTLQFEVLTKSATKATDLIASFRQEAIKSPLNVSDYAQAGKTLMAFGVSADETLPILKTLGDVSMGNAERFAGLALAFAQTQAAGRLMGQEVLQFVNAGFNPLQEISRKTGRSMVELKKAMEDGAISASMVTEAFRSATAQGGLFFGALDKGASTTEGRIAKLRDSMDQLKVSFGTGFNEGLKSALDATSNFLPQLESQFATAGQTIGMAITDAVNGNYDMFVNVGLLMGEAIKQGIMDIGGNALVEGILRPAYAFVRSPTGYKTDQYGMDQAEILFGPKRSVGQRAEDIKTALAPNVSDLKQSKQEAFARGTERWGEYLRRQAEATDELVRQGKKITKENMNQLMFSR